MKQSIGIIFDVDGIIADSEAVNVRATQKAFRDIIGISNVIQQDFQEGIGRGAKAYVRAGARAHHKELTTDEVQALVHERQNNFLEILKHEKLSAFPGVLELINATINNDEFRLAIATSSTKVKSQAVLDAAGIPYNKMIYLCGDDVSQKKPDPELFVTACQKLMLEPEFCVVIEDAPNGIAAAKAALCKCIAVSNTCARNALQAADLIVDSLETVFLNTIKELIF